MPYVPPAQKVRQRRLVEGSKLWKQREREVLAAYEPPIISCSVCGSPRHKHYLCLFCHKE